MQKSIILLIFCCGFLVNAQTGDLDSADSLYATGNYTLAINEYSKSGSPSASLQIARAYNAIGNFDKAIGQYESILNKNPKLRIAGFELGKLYLKSNEYDKARKLFTKLVSTRTGNPEYHYYLGEAFRELGQSASSLVSYKNAVEKDSTHLRSLFQLAKYFTIKQERGQVLRYVDKGLEFYSNDVSLINLKALIYFNDNQYEKAIPWFEKVLELGEHKEYVYEKLGYCYYKNWEFDKAKKAYQEVIAINDDNSDAYFSLAEVFRKNKQLDSAEVFINKGMAIKKPIFAKGYSALAGLYRERNDLKIALKYYLMAHDESPEDSNLYYNVCTVNDQLSDDPKKKLDYYENFILKYGKERPYISDMVARRISELKEQIHFAKE